MAAALKRVLRLDVGTINGVERTPQGGLRIPSYPTRTGVLTYRNADGTERRELRHPSEVFKPESLATLRNAPITDLHPAAPVTSSNWKALAVGHVGEDVKQDGSHVSAPLLIQHADTVAKVERGERKELSCGYECNLDFTPGIYDGQQYDAAQKDISYNHLAIGPEGWGRAGSSVALRLDAGDAAEVQSTGKSVSREGASMKTVRIDGVDYEIGSESHLQAVARRDAAQAALLAEVTAKLEKANLDGKAAGDLATAEKKRADDAAAALVKATDPKTILAAVTKRADMIDKCRTVAKSLDLRFDDEEAAGQTEEGMMLQALKAIDPDFDATGKSPDFLMGAFLMAVKNILASMPGGEEEEAAVGDDMATPGGDREQEVSGGVVPPAAPGRSDGGKRRRGDSAPRSIFAARGAASREDGRGEAVQRGDKATRADSPQAAEDRMRKDQADAWTQPLAYSKDPPRAPVPPKA